MAWVKVDDQAPRHHKMLTAGPAACWLWVCGIAHAQSQLTDGFIALAVLPMIGIKGSGRAQQLAEALVAAGLFDRADGGYQVHDYLDHNPSRAAVLTKRAEDAERKRKAESERTPRGIQPDSGAPRARVPSHPIPSQKNTSCSGTDLFDRAESAGRQNGELALTNGALAKALHDQVRMLTSRTKEFIVWFKEEYELQRHGAAYLVKWKRDGKLVKDMLDTATYVELQDDARIMLSDKCEDKFIMESDRGIPMLSTKFNWLNGRRVDWELRQRGGTS